MEALPQHAAILPALTAATLRRQCLPCCVPDRSGAAGCDGSPRADRGFPERRDRRGDPFAGTGRADRWLVRRAADTAGGGTAWNATRYPGDARLATENGLGRGDGRRHRNGCERRHSRSCRAPAVATPGGRCRRRGRGGAPDDRVGAGHRRGLFTAVVRVSLREKQLITLRMFRPGCLFVSSFRSCQELIPPHDRRVFVRRRLEAERYATPTRPRGLMGAASVTAEPLTPATQSRHGAMCVWPRISEQSGWRECGRHQYCRMEE